MCPPINLNPTAYINQNASDYSSKNNKVNMFNSNSREIGGLVKISDNFEGKIDAFSNNIIHDSADVSITGSANGTVSEGFNSSNAKISVGTNNKFGAGSKVSINVHAGIFG